MNAVKAKKEHPLTKWAIEDPVDELVALNTTIQSYKKRCKKIINQSLIVSFLYFSFVIFSLLLTIFSLTNAFFFSQSYSTFYLLESGFYLFLHLLSIPFTTIVILFLLQCWKFYEVLINRSHTIDKIWDEDTFKPTTNTKESQWNPIELNLMILGEMEDTISQVKKQIFLSIICLAITSLLILIPAILHLLINPIFLNLNMILLAIIPIILLLLTLFIISSLMELHRFISWQYQQFKIIDTIYSNPPPLIDSQSKDTLIRLKKFLQKDTLLQSQGTIHLSTPFNVDTIKFDMGGRQKDTLLFVRTCKSIIPTLEEIEQFKTDIDNSIMTQNIKPIYIRAILLCDWREEEGELSEEIEQEILNNPILLRKKFGKQATTKIQLIMDNGRIYSMFPLVAEKKIDEDL